jgi:hypothetical protein
MNFKTEKTPFRVAGTYLSRHPQKEYEEEDYLVTRRVDEIELTTQGINGDRHHGYTTQTGGRFGGMYKEGTTVRNSRQWSAISQEEIKRIAIKLNLDARLTPEMLGINLVLEGIPAISELAPMTHLLFSPHRDFAKEREEDVMLVVYAQALPCRIAGRAIARETGTSNVERMFPSAALGIRGTTGWVEKGGIIKPGYNGWALTPTGKD